MPVVAMHLIACSLPFATPLSHQSIAPGPWQVIIHQQEDGEAGTVVAALEERPSYNEAVALMKEAGYRRYGG